eukprot:3637225-Pleurochrysis_carterae.AAC.1
MQLFQTDSCSQVINHSFNDRAHWNANMPTNVERARNEWIDLAACCEAGWRAYREVLDRVARLRARFAARCRR